MKLFNRIACLLLALTLLCGTASAVSLKKGSRGLNVLYAQQRLQHLGYELDTPDGSFGAATQKAVKAFQKDRKLKTTGAINDETWDALFNESVQLYSSVGTGLDSKTFTITYNLPAPFTTMQRQQNNRNLDGVAVMEVDTLKLTAQLIVNRTLDTDEQSALENVKKAYDETFVPQYNGRNYQVSQQESFEINGKPARVFRTTWEFDNGGTLVHYSYHGCVELDEVNGTQTLLIADMNYNISPRTQELLSIEVVKEALAAARCRRDVKYEYQAGASQRLKKAKLKISIPDFQPLDAGTGISSTLEALRQYVNPAADGAEGKLEGDTLISFYYGVRLMDWYQGYIVAGNSREDVLTQARLGLGVAAMDKDVREDLPAIRAQFAAAFSAAELALKKTSKAALTALGLDAPAWKAEDLAAMRDNMLNTFDALITRNEN